MLADTIGSSLSQHFLVYPSISLMNLSLLKPWPIIDTAVVCLRRSRRAAMALTKERRREKETMMGPAGRRDARPIILFSIFLVNRWMWEKCWSRTRWHDVPNIISHRSVNWWLLIKLVIVAVSCVRLLPADINVRHSKTAITSSVSNHLPCPLVVSWRHRRSFDRFLNETRCHDTTNGQDDSRYKFQKPTVRSWSSVWLVYWCLLAVIGGYWPPTRLTIG